MAIISTRAALPQIKPAGLRRFHARLAAWYAAHGRHDLPWRKTADPYAIWISEVMLQQTQVSTVLARFYHPFLTRFPTVDALATAPREAVMKAWEGLGYYRRAGFLHAAAQQVASAPDATFPQAVDHLLALPGIGKNTAHAIAAFAYHQPVAILEANVKRIVARIFALRTPSDAELWAGAEALLDAQHPFDYNQSMMDLGSLICLPKNPLCTQCPASDICLGKTDPHAYPTPKAKKQTPVRELTIAVLEDANGKYFLEARDAQLLGGLYGFTQLADAGDIDALCQQMGVTPTHRAALGTVTHVYSHFKLIGQVEHIRTVQKMNGPHWHSRAEIAALPLSKVDHKTLALVENCHTAKKKIPKAGAKRRPR
ncbi:MAG: A/G-specific adenine glycosylase [Pseudomonadota bacterium]